VVIITKSRGYVEVDDTHNELSYQVDEMPGVLPM